MNPATIRFKYDYTSCGIDKKPKWALVVPAPDERQGVVMGKGGKYGIHSYYAIKEHAELVQTAIPDSLVRSVSYTDRGEPIISLPETK